MTNSTLQAECPRCGESFMLKDSTLFDGLGPFPQDALKIQTELQETIKQREAQLKRKKTLADTATEQGAFSSGLGKILEKIAPAHKDFKIPLYDCRPLYEPIDLIAFNGLGKGKINSVDFIEIKSGKTARLNEHEKMVKAAIEEGKVDLKVIR